MSYQAEEAAIYPIDYPINISMEAIAQSAADNAYLTALDIKHRVERVSENIGNFAGAVKDEIIHGEKRIRSAGSMVGTLGIWGAGIAKVPSAILIPTTSMEVLERTGNSVAAGAATTAVYGAWALASSRSWSSSIENFPDAVGTVAEAYPNAVGRLSETLPCMHEEDIAGMSRQKRIGKWIMTHAKRGVSSYSIGSMPYMVSAGLDGKSREERAKLGNRLSADGAAVVGGITLGVSQLIVEIDKISPDGADIMQDRIGDMKTWFGIAGLMIIREAIKNKRSNKSE